MEKHFCNCRDLACPFHPANHDQGCDLCIQKNLRQGEIPACFFRSISEDLEKVEDFSYKGFCQFVKERA